MYHCVQGNVDNGGGHVCVVPGGTWEISVSSALNKIKPIIFLKMKMRTILKMLHIGPDEK